MKPRESALRVLCRQADFEITLTAAALATADAARVRTEQDTRTARDHNEALLVALRRQLGSRAINPALIASLRSAYAAARANAASWEAKLVQATHDEASIRDSLASVRHKASYFEAELAAESAATRAARLAREAAGLDDLWLSRRVEADR
jgi:hypothetical protein